VEIVFFTHPAFTSHQSMPRFSQMLAMEMKKRGHKVELWSPHPVFVRVSKSFVIRKWMGYIDQYILFPFEVRRRIKHCSHNTLFVFTDQALGPWLSLVKERPNVIHCHDLLALRSAIREFAENPTSWSGRYYQAYIHRGFSAGRNFISVSNNTKEQLHRFLSTSPIISEVVYNGFNRVFYPTDAQNAKRILSEKLRIDLRDGFLFHIGGNAWYKNRSGVIELYDAWRSVTIKKLPLLMIGDKPDNSLWKRYQSSPFKSDIHLKSGADDEIVSCAYSGAMALLFPSIAEGFGWPIAEAMASGCPVITTNEPPMTEVAGNAGLFIPRRPIGAKKVAAWAFDAAKVIDGVVECSPSERQALINAGLNNAKRFDAKIALDKIEATYQKVLQISRQE
jgi:glycosyltransferase involved in cell wall biosynthesis